jgi:hypothetical protein
VYACLPQCKVREAAVLVMKKVPRTMPPPHPVPESTATPTIVAATAPGAVRDLSCQASAAMVLAVSEAAQRATGSGERELTVDGSEYSLTALGGANKALELVL